MQSPAVAAGSCPSPRKTLHPRSHLRLDLDRLIKRRSPTSRPLARRRVRTLARCRRRGSPKTAQSAQPMVPSPSPRPTSADLISSGESRQAPTPRYSLTTAWVLWAVALLGVAGLNRFYLGKRGTGLLWLLTWGLLGIGIVYDALTMQTQVAQANVRMASASPHTTVRRIDPMRAPTRASHEEKEAAAFRAHCAKLVAEHYSQVITQEDRNAMYYGWKDARFRADALAAIRPEGFSAEQTEVLRREVVRYMDSWHASS